MQVGRPGPDLTNPGRAYLEIAGMARSSFMMSGALASGALFRTVVGMPLALVDPDKTGEILRTGC